MCHTTVLSTEDDSFTYRVQRISVATHDVWTIASCQHVRTHASHRRTYVGVCDSTAIVVAATATDCGRSEFLLISRTSSLAAASGSRLTYFSQTSFRWIVYFWKRFPIKSTSVSCPRSCIKSDGNEKLNRKFFHLRETLLGKYFCDKTAETERKRRRAKQVSVINHRNSI